MNFESSLSPVRGDSLTVSHLGQTSLLTKLKLDGYCPYPNVTSPVSVNKVYKQERKMKSISKIPFVGIRAMIFMGVIHGPTRDDSLMVERGITP